MVFAWFLALPALAGDTADRAAPVSRDVLGPVEMLMKAMERFTLLPKLFSPSASPQVPSAMPESHERLLHQKGDPDSLITLGGSSPEGELRVKPAFEINEIFLKANPPDIRVDPTDTRPRSAGSFTALDERGRPYQFRLGARLVW